MKNCIVQAFCVLICLNQFNAHISIDIEPEELQRFGEILVHSYMTRDLLHNHATSVCKKVLVNTAQLFGIMFSLVGANLLTNTLQPFVSFNPQADQLVITMNDTLKPSEICKHDFGCDGNLCWRSCDDEINTSLSWCYTVEKIRMNEIKTCEFSHECSPCWSCIGACKSPKT